MVKIKRITIIQNIYKKDIENKKIQEILLKSYKIFIRKEMEICLWK